MLRWTSSGAVSAPQSLQIRLSQRFPGRVQAGAPVPRRALKADELVSNILHFTARMRGPRQRPCTTLVLSGGGLGRRDDLPAALRLARKEGIRRVVLHASAADLVAEEGLAPAADPGWAALVDVLVLPFTEPGLLASLLRTVGARTVPRVVVNVSLQQPMLKSIPPLADGIAASVPEARPDEVVWTWPFPGPGTSMPPDIHATAELVRAASLTLQDCGVANTLKGLPPCLSGPMPFPRRKTGNRWYVDADHQHDDALLFLPTVARFHKSDSCRFCREDQVCDGFFAEYLDRPGCPGLHPVDAS